MARLLFHVKHVPRLDVVPSPPHRSSQWSESCSASDCPSASHPHRRTRSPEPRPEPTAQVGHASLRGSRRDTRSGARPSSTAASGARGWRDATGHTAPGRAAKGSSTSTRPSGPHRSAKRLSTAATAHVAVDALRHGLGRASSRANPARAGSVAGVPLGSGASHRQPAARKAATPLSVSRETGPPPHEGGGPVIRRSCSQMRPSAPRSASSPAASR